jgi:recombination protein RecA
LILWKKKRIRREIMAKSDRSKAIDGVLKGLEKKYKTEFSSDQLKVIDRWVLDIPFMDYLYGGGLAKGRIYEPYGKESSGKTSLCILVAATLQKKYDAHITFIDAEYAFDPTFYEKNTGLMTDKEHWLYLQPDFGEQGLEFAEKLAEAGATDLIIIDSVAALTPKAEVEGEMGDAFMGLQARMMGQGLRKLTAVLADTHTSIFFINQVRDKIGSYGNPQITPAGNALKFFSSGRYETYRTDYLKEGEDNIVGIKIRTTSRKSKIAPPFRKVEMDFYFEKGFDIDGQYVELALQKGLIERGGAWYTLPDGNKVQGQEKVKEYFRENTTEYDKLKKKLYSILFDVPAVEKETKANTAKIEEALEAAKEVDEKTYYEGEEEVPEYEVVEEGEDDIDIPDLSDI